MYLYRLVNALARRGHEVDVIHCADSYHVLQPQMPSKQFPNHPNVTVHTLRSRWGMLSPLLTQQTGGTWFKTEQILRVLMSKKFDVIHYHNASLLGPRALELAPDYADFLRVYTTHEHWLICPMHVLWKDNERPCDKPECLRCTLKFRRPPQWWRYTRRLEKSTAGVDLFLSPSRFTRQMHRERGFTRDLECLPYFVEIAPAATAGAEPSPHPRPYFLFVGRLEKLKGLQAVLPVFQKYKEADLLVAGTGMYEQELREQAHDMLNVIFLGSLQQGELEALYRHAIAVIVPSIGYEVFGIIIIEAFRKKTPVIAHALGGLQEVVEESGGGLLYRTPAELLEAMDRLRTDGALRREMGERGYRKTVELWSEEAHLHRYSQMLGEAAQRKFGAVPWESPQRMSLAFPAVAG